jgi:sugar phosphate isomerase/epimerase
MTKPVALQLYAVRDAAAKDLFAVLKRIAQMGYAGVEIGGLQGKTPADVAKVLKDLGLKVSSSHAPLPNKDNIAQIAANAQTLGYKHIITGFGAKEMESEDACKAIAAKLAPACEVARSAGLSLAIHNHWWEFDHAFNGKTPYEIIMSAVPELCGELDIYWCARGGQDVPSVVKRFSRQITLMHVKDGDLGAGSIHKPVGQGKVPVAPIINAADPQRLEWLIVELDNCATDMFEAVDQSLKWLIANALGHGAKK